MEHALRCFARLVRVLLGASAVADDKCEFGRGLVVLGVDIQMSPKGYTFKPASAKVGVRCVAAVYRRLRMYLCAGREVAAHDRRCAGPG